MSKKARLSGILSLVLVLSSCGFNDVIDVSYGSSDEHDTSSGSVTNDAFYIEESHININYNLIAPDTENYSYQLSLVKTSKYEGETITYTFDPNYVEDVSNDGLISFNMENFFSVKSFSVIASVEDGSSDYVLITFGKQTDSYGKSVNAVNGVSYDKKTNILECTSNYPIDEIYVYVNGVLEYFGDINEVRFPLKSQHNQIEIIFRPLAMGILDWSLWSEPLIVNFDNNQDLVWKVNNFAARRPRIYVLKSVMSIHSIDNNFYTTGIFEHEGVDLLYTWSTRFENGIDKNNLRALLNIEKSKRIISEHEIKNYDTEISFLSRQDNEMGFSEQIQSLADEWYRLSFVISQAYESETQLVGLKGILKASFAGFADVVHYYSVDIEMDVGPYSDEEYKYTSAVENIESSLINERTFIELTGDFAEYARQLDELMNQ